MEQLLPEWRAALGALFPKLVTALLIFLVSLYLAKLVSGLLRRVLARRQVNAGAEQLLSETTRWGIIIYGSVMALQQFADVTAFLAGLGILGFTVGFALQDVMKNFAAGVLLLLQKPFRIGDDISVAGFEGTVTAIDLRSTEIRTFDGRAVIVPNADVLNQVIVNFTRSVNRRIELPVGVAYGSDLEQVQTLALEAIGQVPGLLADPTPQVVFRNFGDSSINFVIFYWVDTNQVSLFTAQDVGLKLVNRAFKKHNINIPYPVYTVLMQKEN